MMHDLTKRAGSFRGIDRIGTIAVSVLVAVSVFAVHRFINNHISIAIFYVVSILLAATMGERKIIIGVGLFCSALLIAGFLLADGPPYSSDSIARSAISLFTLAVTTFLLLIMEGSRKTLQSQARLLEEAHDSILVRDMNGHVIYLNRAAESLFECPREAAIGKAAEHLIDIIYPTSQDIMLSELTQNGRWEGDVQYATRSGTRLTAACRWSLNRDDRGRPIAILETAHDVTAVRAAQDELAQAKENLEHVARLSMLGELTTSIAHEVKQPLSAIVTHGEACLRWLERGSLAVDEIRDSVEWMIRDGRRAADVIDRLQSLSRQRKSFHEDLDVGSLIEASIPLLAYDFAKNNVDLLKILAPGLPRVFADSVQLQQVIINLLLNAVQAAMDAPRDARRVCISARAAGPSSIVVEIADNGRGIAQIEERLFEPFFTTKPDGMGVGLSICRSIVESLGGRISAETNRDGGATFSFTLPTMVSANG